MASIRSRMSNQWIVVACAALMTPVFATGQSCAFGSELLPFVPAAGWPDGLQGFVRLVNPGSDRVTVRFVAHDDAGNAHPLTVRLGPGETLHFNSSDLEYGNVDKGGLAGTGAAPARGHWWLCFPLSAHAVEPTAYIRTRDGFLTDMTPSVAFAHTWECVEHLCAEWHVPIFNPASNTNQVSRLRLINNSDVDVPVIVLGYRGDGSRNREEDRPLRVSAILGASSVQELSAVELETGQGLEGKLANNEGEPYGSLGPSLGKWRLVVRSHGLVDSGQLVIVNLMASATGHVTNLSVDHTDAWIRR